MEERERERETAKLLSIYSKAPGPRMAPRMVEPGFVGHTFEECDQMFRRQATEDNVLPELVDTSDDDVQLPDLEEVF